MSVPNYSAGRDAATVAELADALARQCKVVDQHVDADHNRCVFTLIGRGEEIEPALEAAAEVAVKRIDLTKHSGVHPRIGVCDVTPIVPLNDFGIPESTTAGAHSIAVSVASDYGELGIPVFLYASSYELQVRHAGSLRSGGLEGISRRLAARDITPDFGPADIHPTAGAAIVGVRSPLVACNVVLDTEDIGVATTVAGAIRESSGGLTGVRALGLPLESRNLVQISMNIENWRSASPAHVVTEIQRRITGICAISEFELVGLIPREPYVALQKCAQQTGLHIVCCEQPTVESWLESVRV